MYMRGLREIFDVLHETRCVELAACFFLTTHVREGHPELLSVQKGCARQPCPRLAVQPHVSVLQTSLDVPCNPSFKLRVRNTPCRYKAVPRCLDGRNVHHEAAL